MLHCVLEHNATHKAPLLAIATMTKPYIVFEPLSVILSDYVYWTEHEQELDDFCTHYGCVQQGLVIEFPTERVLTLFMLRY